MLCHFLGQVDHLAIRIGDLEIRRGVAHTQIDDALCTLTDHIGQIGPAILIEDVVVQNVLADRLFAGIVEPVEHVVECEFQHDWVVLAGRLHQVNAAQETGVLATAERPHHGLDPVRQRHRTDQAVVTHVEITQEHPFVPNEPGLLPGQELGEVSARVILDEFVLGAGEFFLLGGHQTLGFLLIALPVLVELPDLVLVGRFSAAVGKPPLVLPALGATTDQTGIPEINLEHRFIRIHDDVTSLLVGLESDAVETAPDLNLSEVELTVDHSRGIDGRHIPSFRLEQIQLA